MGVGLHLEWVVIRRNHIEATRPQIQFHHRRGGREESLELKASLAFLFLPPTPVLFSDALRDRCPRTPHSYYAPQRSTRGERGYISKEGRKPPLEKLFFTSDSLLGRRGLHHPLCNLGIWATYGSLGRGGRVGERRRTQGVCCPDWCGARLCLRSRIDRIHNRIF